jgi:hypothetical protein
VAAVAKQPGPLVAAAQSAELAHVPAAATAVASMSIGVDCKSLPVAT